VAAIDAKPRGALVLIGFMGAGKSTVAAELAAELGSHALDSDALLEERLGHSLAEEFAAPLLTTAGAAPAAGRPSGGGERAFRAKEEELVCELLATAAPGAVVALGGGSVLSEHVQRALEDHLVVLLDVGAEQAWQRVRGQPGAAERPLARDRETFFALHAERRALYERLADAHLPALEPGGAGRTLNALRALWSAPARTRMLWARSASGEYPVLVGRGLLEAEPMRLLRLASGLDSARSRAFCVSDEAVAALYAQRLGELAGEVVLAPGESQKSLRGAERVWEALVDAGITSSDHVVALGGGVVGDLAGFCAATYQRGMPIVHIPTTLVAQVDSAYGGKTGVDLPRAKNYVGAYHQPAGVLVDPGALATLPAAELAAGWVEVLKTALIAGGELWQRVSGGEEVDERMILSCARIKLAVVAEDERDADRRQVLNLGHTVGHAIETATGYGSYRHGEAVGLGLLAALRLSGQQQLRTLVAEMLAARGLPVRLEGASVEGVLDALGRDKKRLDERVRFVLVRAPGVLSTGNELPEQEVRAAVEELAR
jgi:shikimate kinase/3-dehydroquinate synthase